MEKKVVVVTIYKFQVIIQAMLFPVIFEFAFFLQSFNKDSVNISNIKIIFFL